MSSFEELSRVYHELQKWKSAETEVSNAYLRLRALIPGAFDTPHAATAGQVWATTEAALKRALANASHLRTEPAEAATSHPVTGE